MPRAQAGALGEARNRFIVARMKEPSTPAAGRTKPWKGRLRSHHATPQSSLPQRLPESRNAAEEAQTSKKQTAPKIPRRGGRWNEDAEAARPPRAPPRRSPRLPGRDPEYPIGADKECKSRDDQSAITSLRRSPRFRRESKISVTLLLPPNPQQISHNRKTRNASIDKNQGNVRRSHRNAAANTLSRIKMVKEPLSLGLTSQDIPSQQKSIDVSRERREEKDLKAVHCKTLTKKRKGGTEGRSLSTKTCYLEPQSMPPHCQEAAPSNNTSKLTRTKSGNDASLPDIRDMKLMNVRDNNEETSGIEREAKESFCGQDDWTEEQDMALQQAYFAARPSPHFWKRVSRMVPGRSAKECFDRIHADLSTPTPIAPRPRRCKGKFSPLGNFSLSDPELPNLLEHTVGRQRTYKQKNFAAQKTVRHLLQKHYLIDQAQGGDLFSVFESSPSALQLNIYFEDSPGTPHGCSNSGSLCNASASSAQMKPFSRLKSRQDEPSPAVLKPVKSAILHEKYINQLCRRAGTKRPRRKATSSNDANNIKAHFEQQAGDMKATKNALISEATDFISHFKKLQANSHANMVEDSEDDEIDDIRFDTGDCCGSDGG